MVLLLCIKTATEDEYIKKINSYKKTGVIWFVWLPAHAFHVTWMAWYKIFMYI